MAEPLKISFVGLVWYRREDYDRLLTIFEDAHKQPRTFDDWLVQAERIEQRQRDRGVRVVRAVIDPDTFPAWCAAKRLKVDSHARNEFASHKAYEAHLQSQ